MKYLFLLLILVGCAKEDSIFETDGFRLDLSNRTTSVELAGIIEDFENLTGVDVNLPVRVTTSSEAFKGTVIGVCLHDDNLIVIDRELLEGSSIILKWVVYHELLHCVQGLGHSDNAQSIMFPSVSGPSIKLLLEDEQNVIDLTLAESKPCIHKLGRP